MTLSKFIIISFSAIVLITMGVSCVKTEKTEAITAEITAAQIEGRKAARNFISKEWKDSDELKKELLETKALQSKYLLEGKKECAESFDSAFISTIRVIKPSLAKSILKPNS